MISIEERVRNLPRLARNVLAGNAGKGVTSLKASGSEKLTVHEVDALIKENGVTDVQEKMAIKLDLEAAGFMESGVPRQKSPYV
jgi:hypothetical protein